MPPQLFSNTKHSLGLSVLTPRTWLPLPISLRGFPASVTAGRERGRRRARDPLGIRAAAHRASAQGHRTAPNSCLGETFLSPWLGGSMEESWAPESWPCCLNEPGVQRGREFLPSCLSADGRKSSRQFYAALQTQSDLRLECSKSLSNVPYLIMFLALRFLLL